MGQAGTVTGVGEPAVDKMGQNFCLQGADILGNTKQALVCGIYCPLVRGVDVVCVCYVLGTAGGDPGVQKKETVSHNPQGA